MRLQPMRKGIALMPRGRTAARAAATAGLAFLAAGAEAGTLAAYRDAYERVTEEQLQAIRGLTEPDANTRTEK